MWNTLVSNSTTVVAHLKDGISEAAASHPVLMVSGVAAALALVGTSWIVALVNEVRELRALLTKSERVIQLRR